MREFFVTHFIDILVKFLLIYRFLKTLTKFQSRWRILIMMNILPLWKWVCFLQLQGYDHIIWLCYIILHKLYWPYKLQSLYTKHFQSCYEIYIFFISVLIYYDTVNFFPQVVPVDDKSEITSIIKREPHDSLHVSPFYYYFS